MMRFAAAEAPATTFGVQRIIEKLFGALHDLERDRRACRQPHPLRLDYLGEARDQIGCSNRLLRPEDQPVLSRR